MPAKSLKPCSKSGCATLTRERYCADHLFVEEVQTRESNKRYDSVSRDKRSEKFYNSKPWRDLRDLAFKRDKGLCQSCLKQRQYKPADVVHHIIEIKSDWEKRLDLENLDSLCHKCHNKIPKNIAPGSEIF